MRDDQGIRADVRDGTTAGPLEEPPAVSEVERPWGAFRQYAHNQRVTVSLMTVLPGRRLSLQSHAGRSELWVVLDDGATVTAGDETRACRAGEEIWIPAGQVPRLSCEGGEPVRVLEVAFGDWHMDDIRRFEDDYGRAPAPGDPSGRR